MWAAGQLVEESGRNVLIQQALTLISLLSLAALVSVVVWRIRLPYTVALVLVGLGLSFTRGVVTLNVSNELILVLLVPPLVFEATSQLQWQLLRQNWLPILLIAVLGTLIGALIVGGLVSRVLTIPLTAALAFGALISATDPVAVVAFFRGLGVDKRLGILVEGESLFNDGIAIVIFNLTVAAGVAIERGSYAGFMLGDSLREFAVVVGGGLLLGAALGGVVSYLILKNVDDPLAETAVTLALAYGAFLLAEEFSPILGLGPIHLSGILSVVAAGLMVGNIGRFNTSPTTKVTLDNFWEFLSYVVNSFVFLIIGLEIDLPVLAQNVPPILVAVGAVLVSRAIVIYSLAWLHSLVQPKLRIPRAYRHIMFWGGLRGAISLALALTLREHFPPALAEQLKVMTFGVVLFTLLVQGLSIERLIRRLGLTRFAPEAVEQQRRQVLVYVKQAGQLELDRLRAQGLIAPEIWEAMRTVYDEEILHARAALREYMADHLELEQAMVLQAREDALRAERVALMDAVRRRLISDEVYQALLHEVDLHSAALQVITAGQNRNEG